MTTRSARLGLQEHNQAVRDPLPKVVEELEKLIGVRLVAYIGGAKDARVVDQWKEGSPMRKPGADARLRLALNVALLLKNRDSRDVVQAWFQGLNPQLDDRSPARVLREGSLDTDGPEVLAAARAFIVGG
jgi:hypothetical protein